MSLTEETCLDCPSYLTADEAVTFFGEAETAFPMCARFGYLFGTSKEPDEKAVSIHRIGTPEEAACAYYGKSRPLSITPAWLPSLFVPDTDLCIITPAGDPKPASCLNCSKCNLEQDASTAVTIRRSCKATGNLVTTKTAPMVAQGCRFGTSGTPMTSEVRDDFTRHFSNSTVDFAAVQRKLNQKLAMLTGPVLVTAGVDSISDAVVLDEHKGMYRAWRKVITPRGIEVFIPIWETSFFSEEDQSRIPKAGDEADPSLYQDHSDLLGNFAGQVYKLDLNLTLVGEPGSGKTDGTRWLAWVMNMPWMRIPYNESTDPEQVLGQKEVRTVNEAGGMETYTSTGLLPDWVQKICVLLSDEWNLAPEAIQQVYREVNDSSRTLTIYGKQYKRHPYCFHLSALNPSWDFRNIGAKTLASADTRRLSFHWMPSPDEKMQRQIISATVLKVDKEKIQKSILDCVVKIGADCREAAKQGKIPDPWTLAQDIKVARLVPYFGIMGALRRAYFDSIDPVVAEAVLTTLKSHIPSGVDWS